MATEADTHSIPEILTHAAHLLPAQGPIGIFIHHNTLHAFQHLPFEQAVVEASQIYGTEPYMAEHAYRADLRRGRIQREDIEAVLAAEPNVEILPGKLDRRSLRRACLLDAVLDYEAATLDWELEEGRLSGEVARESFDVCLQRTSGRPLRQAELHRASAEFSELHEQIHPFLIRLCGAYLDQGMAYWPMPARELGFYQAVRELLAPKGMLLPEALRGLDAECRRQASQKLDSEQAVHHALQQLGIAKNKWTEFLEQELLALAGWAGLFRRLEQAPELAPHIPVRCSLLDFLAVRLTLLVVAFRSSRINQRTPHSSEAALTASRVAAAHLAEAASALGLTPQDLQRLPDVHFTSLAEEVADFPALERRRLFHLAYERRHERQILIPLESFRQRRIGQAARTVRPAAHVFFCIDEREESIRRHLEEIDPQVETLGAAGFFGLAIDYAGIDDAHGVSLCPVVVTPQHAVREKPASSDAGKHSQRLALRRMLGQLLHNSHVGSKALVRGWLATATLGLFSLFPLIARILSPRAYAKLRDKINETLIPRPETELTFTRQSEDRLHGLAQGFSIQEKADRVAGVLFGSGLQENYARIVVVLGHSATTVNNPLESAYNCGACGGRSGGPNARLFAAMANHPEVRLELSRRGIHIPQDTWFVGGYHDTCSDFIEIFDSRLVPETHAADLTRIRKSFDQARALNAHERGRRFEYCRVGASSAGALRHVEERSEHLAEPRPEYGHCTNAVAIVGRRSTTRGLFFDRRAFLISYDASIDPTDEFLAQQLNAVTPVCAGISLEYYFSFVDNEKYGCGTKLPHNVTGLVGVMNGAASDLRTGLAKQMVEIHEPVRILFVIETSPERLSKVIAANPGLKEFVENRWIRISTIHPDTGRIHVYRHGAYEPLEGEPHELPVAPTSVDWYRGRGEHLPVAQIGELQEVA